MWAIVEDDAMNFEVIGGVRIFRPRTSMELRVRQAAELDLRQNYSLGTYSSRDEINGILHHRYEYFDQRLKVQLPKCASLEMLKFVLWQYEQSCEVGRQYKTGLLSPNDRERWEELGPFFRRSIKYLAECITMAEPSVNPQCDKDEALELLDECWICGELLVDLSVQSSQTFMLFPEHTTLDIRPPGELDYIILEVEDSTQYTAFQQRMAADTAGRSEFIAPDELFGVDRVVKHVDESCKSSLGFSYSQAFNFLHALTLNVEQPNNGFDVPVVRKQDVVDAAVADLGINEEQANRMLQGVSLCSSDMRSQDGGNGRMVWKPKQEYRAYARPFFHFAHESAEHLVWSRQMTQESLVGALSMRLTQGHLPVEWQSRATRDAIEKYRASITESFEASVLRELRKVGVSCDRFHRKVGTLPIPADVGEIDCLAYIAEHQLLLVADCKFLTPTTEPATFRDDLTKFLNGTHNYNAQILRKARWAQGSASDVESALAACKSFPSNVHIGRIVPVIVTYCPTFASLFMDEVTCVAMTEIIRDIQSEKVLSYPTIEPE